MSGGCWDAVGDVVSQSLGIRLDGWSLVIGVIRQVGKLGFGLVRVERSAFGSSLQWSRLQLGKMPSLLGPCVVAPSSSLADHRLEVTIQPLEGKELRSRCQM